MPIFPDMPGTVISLDRYGINISTMRGIKTKDIISTVQSLNMIRFWKEQHVVFVMQDFLRKYHAKEKRRPMLCDSRCLRWTSHAERKGAAGTAATVVEIRGEHDLCTTWIGDCGQIISSSYCALLNL